MSLFPLFVFCLGALVGTGLFWWFVLWSLEAAGYVYAVSGKLKCIECGTGLRRAIVNPEFSGGYLFCTSECCTKYALRTVDLFAKEADDEPFGERVRRESAWMETEIRRTGNQNVALGVAP